MFSIINYFIFDFQNLSKFLYKCRSWVFENYKKILLHSYARKFCGQIQSNFWLRIWQYHNCMIKGNLPNSDNTKKFVLLLWTPRRYLQNLRCILSQGKFLKQCSTSNFSHFRNLLVNIHHVKIISQIIMALDNF